MRSQWRRLFWAAFLSGCGFCATYAWYISTEKKLSNTGESPLAQVGKVGDEVLRRPSDRLLWSAVSTGDSLFNGETVRTSERGEIRIQFDDGRFIDLEPDSMIVLKKSQGEIALDLMEGSLFVNAQVDKKDVKPGDVVGPGLVLNSGQGKVDLSGASASLAKGKGNAVDVQVLEGKAKIQNKNGQSQEISKGSTGAISDAGISFNMQNLKIISPSLDKPTYIDPEIESKITFQWKGFPPNWKINLWAGERRKDLRDLGQVEGTVEKILARMPMGKNYWKLVGTDPATGKVAGESSIYKLDVVGRYAPTVLFPTADAKIQSETPTYDLTFRWQKGEEASGVALEVATDPSMKNKILSRNFTNEEQHLVPKLKDGDYFWRMSAYYADSDKPVAGKVQKFSIRKPIREIPKDPARIGWVTPETTVIQYYLAEPTLQLSWKAETRQDEIKEWRMNALEVGQSQESVQKFSTANPQLKTKLPKPGKYLVSIEALNKEGIVIGKSTERTMELQTFPLLTSPQILPLEGDLTAFEDGRSDVKWQAVEGAKEYELIVKNGTGKELARKKYSSAQTSLKSLLPGKYFLQVLAIDQYGRSSEELPPKTLLVPDKSNVRAPSNFRVKVKDK